MEVEEIRTALGIAEDVDPVAAIAAMRAENAALKGTIGADAALADKAEMARLRGVAADAQRRLLTIEGETNQRIAALEEERRIDKATNKVDGLIAKGRIKPVLRETALDLAQTMTEEKFDAFVATLPGVDLAERGMASGSELAELEPSATDISMAKQMGNWNDSNPTESRIALMRVKAKAKGLTLPAEIK